MPENPKPSSDRSSPDISPLLRLIHRAERLEALPRTGWIVCGVEGPESVASHSYIVTLIALWIADHVEEQVDVELMLRMALFHDIAESMLTDLPGPVKALIGRDTVTRAEADISQKVLEEACPGWGVIDALYRDKKSIEARIVKAADRLQMLAKALQYHTQRRGDVRRFLEAQACHDEGIPLVGEIFDALMKCYREEGWFISDFD
ncbi:MAG: HD domain-containing protein [Bradymonadaceae bacterium]